MSINLTWDLDSIFPNGSQSVEFADFLAGLDAAMRQAEASKLPGPLNSATQLDWLSIFQSYLDLSARLSHAGSYVGCLVSQDVKDETARLLDGRLDRFSARLEGLWTRLNAAAADQPDADWDNLMQTSALKPVAFKLSEQRTLAKQKMPADLESLAAELAADGYHAWDQLYGTVSGLKQVEFEEDGKAQQKSLGQLQHKFMGDPDRSVRQRAFEAYQLAWQDLAPTVALALNYQAGFRLTLYRRRGWDSVLKEPLFNNRLSQDTLDAMWNVVAAKSHKLQDYFKAKAALLGVDKLKWYDISAPVGKTDRKFSFAEAGDFIVDNIGRFNPNIADFCRMAIDNSWVESEDRPGKRAGAFCTGFPLTNQTRIFMTFDGSFNALSTLAHELGHGYHNWVMRDLPYGARRYTMSVAETASTFNELIVKDAALKIAADKQERLGLLSQKLDDAAGFMMNIRARYDFERAFFDKRSKGSLSIDELSDLMLQAQQNAYHHSLAKDGYFPLFWASKLHFYITRAPFYNFPYTFGYLFSYGVYRQALQEGPGFKDRYIAMLRDTGSMDTETLARTHLGVDLTQPAFWKTAVDGILADVDEFITLAKV